MRPRTQKQPRVKKELCRALNDVDVDEIQELINVKKLSQCLAVMVEVVA